METIDFMKPREGYVGQLLITAFAYFVSKEDQERIIERKEPFVVEFKFNGIELSFVDVINYIRKRMDAEFEEHVKRAATEMITNSKLFLAFSILFGMLNGLLRKKLRSSILTLASGWILIMTNWKYTIELRDFWNKVYYAEGSVADVIKAFLAAYENVPARFKDTESEEFVEKFQYMLEKSAGVEDDIDTDEFDDVWSEVYDWADAHKIWIQTF